MENLLVIQENEGQNCIRPIAVGQFMLKTLLN